LPVEIACIKRKRSPSRLTGTMEAGRAGSARKAPTAPHLRLSLPVRPSGHNTASDCVGPRQDSKFRYPQPLYLINDLFPPSACETKLNELVWGRAR
jgi:hypothetical protein